MSGQPDTFAAFDVCETPDNRVRLDILPDRHGVGAITIELEPTAALGLGNELIATAESCLRRVRAGMAGRVVPRAS